MIKLIIGKKGAGKTKTLIDLVNEALTTSNGCVVCIEKGKKLTYDVKYQCRLVNADEFFVSDAQSLFGFAAGILASNHDVTDLYIDSALMICGHDVAAFDKFVAELADLSEKVGVNCVVAAAIDPADASETVKKYI